MNLISTLLVLIAGLAVGATSLGGILVVPALTTVAGIQIGEAIAASSFSFLFTGAATVWLQRSKTSLDQPNLGMNPNHYLFAALLGAGLGAFTLNWLPPPLIRALVAFAAILSGIMALRRPPTGPARSLEPVTLTCIGFAVGCASAWSGTGGPVLLLPILIFSRVPLASAVVMAQVIQLPIATASTLVNFTAGRLDLALGCKLAILVMIGWLIGRQIAQRMTVSTLQRAVATGLILVGLAYGWQSFQAHA